MDLAPPVEVPDYGYGCLFVVAMASRVYHSKMNGCHCTPLGVAGFLFPIDSPLTPLFCVVNSILTKLACARMMLGDVVAL